MARIRSVKPEFWDDQELAEHVSRDARLLYIGLWNLADEHGRLRGDPRFIRGRIFPYDDDLSLEDISKMLKELVVVGKVVQYRTTSGVYVFLPNLGKHQRLEADKVPSRLPSPNDPGSELLTPTAQVRADESARDPDESAPGADRSSLLYVAGSMGHISSAPDEPVRAGEERSKTRASPSTDPGRQWTPAQIDADPAWVAFWDAYPLKKDKGHARTAWLKVLRRGVDPQRIVEAAQTFRGDPKRKPDFTAYPATWLNGERWDDQPAEPSAPPGPRPFWEN